MNKIFLAVCALCLALTTQAQQVTTEEEGAQDSSTSGQTTPETSVQASPKTTVECFTVEYQAIDGGFGIGLSGHGSLIEFGVDYFFLDTNESLSEASAFNVKLGGNYAYWLGNSFYIEGSVGLMYKHSEWKYKGEDSQKDNTFGFYLSPRIGLRLTKSIGITAAYHWDFNEFKTSTGYVADYFSVGVAIGI